MIDRIRFKILDNLEFEKEKICQNCGKVIKYRNWITYFGHVTNVSVLRGLDIWIWKRIYNSYYTKTRKRLNKKTLSKFNRLSLDGLYYECKRNNKKNIDYCECGNDLFYNHIEYY